MSYIRIPCPACGENIRIPHNPAPTVDAIIEMPDGIVLIERKNEPFGWALPGGFVDYGETLEAATVREALEETGVNIHNLRLLGCYSDPQRDPRRHTISTVYVAQGRGIPVAGDDAAGVAVFPLTALPEKLCFDHGLILQDYLNWKAEKAI